MKNSHTYIKCVPPPKKNKNKGSKIAIKIPDCNRKQLLTMRRFTNANYTKVPPTIIKFHDVQ